MRRRLSAVPSVRLSAAGLACIAFAGCADFPAPLSEVVVVGTRNLGYNELFRDGLKADGSPTHAIDVHLVAVDGRVSSVSAMDPGEHTITLSASKRGTGEVPVEKTYRVEIEPCRSHWFMAQWRPGPEPDWELLKIRAYDVPGCDPVREGARVRDAAAAEARPAVVAQATTDAVARRPSP